MKYLPVWFPFAQFKRHALFTRGLVFKMFDTPYQWVKDQIVCRYVGFVPGSQHPDAQFDRLMVPRHLVLLSIF